MKKEFHLENNRIIEGSGASQKIHIYVCPNDEEKKFLIEEMKIDEHTYSSSLDPNELARMEFEPEHAALIIKRPKRYSSEDNFFFHVSSIGVFIFHDLLIILLTEDINIFDGKHFTKVYSLPDVALKIMHRSIFHFEEHLKVINMISEELEGMINKATGNRHLINMFTLEKSLVYYLNAIGSNGRVIDKLKLNAAKFSMTPENLEFLDDLAIENAQCNEQAHIYSQVLSGLMDARASVISNNLNIMLKNLNALVIAVAIPSFFAGMGGMSEFSRMIGFSHWKYGYATFFCTMLLIGALSFIAIKKSERFWNEDKAKQ